MHVKSILANDTVCLSCLQCYRGVPFDAIINGLHSAIVKAGQHLKHPITATLILCFVRDLSEFDAIKTLLQAVPYLRHISGVGLASAEVGNPPRKFQALFATAAGLGLHRVAHAGKAVANTESRAVQIGYCQLARWVAGKHCLLHLLRCCCLHPVYQSDKAALTAVTLLYHPEPEA